MMRIRVGFARNQRRYRFAGGMLLGAFALACHGLAAQSDARPTPRITRVTDAPFPFSVSPDGRFVAEIGSFGNLAIRIVSTGELRNLTRSTYPQLVMNGAFSPSSDLIAFAWHNEEDHDDLRIVGVDGAASRVLYRDPAVRSIRVKGWSPDGEDILVTLRHRDRSESIAVVPRSGGDAEVIASFESRGDELSGLMAFAPGGHLIAYDRSGDDSGDEHDLYMTTVTGRRPVPIAHHPADDRLLGWSPSGEGVVFASDRSGSVDVWHQPISEGAPDGAPERLLSGVGPLMPLGSDGDGTYYIARVDCDCRVMMGELDVDGGASPEPAAVFAPAIHNTGAYWSPDGAHLASIEPAGGVTPQAWELVIRTADGHIWRRWPVPVNILHQLRPLWSPDGRTVLVKGWDRGAYPREVVLAVDVESGRQTMLLESPSVWDRQLDWVTWAADGRSLFYTDLAADGSVGLFRWDLGSRTEETLLDATPPPYYYGLTPSPDGRSLAFCHWDTGNGVSRLVVMDLATGDQTTLADVQMPASIGPPAWSPSSRHLYYGTGEQLWRISLSGGEPRRVPFPESIEYNQAGLDLHPDGRRVAFVREGERASAVWALEGLFPPP